MSLAKNQFGLTLCLLKELPLEIDINETIETLRFTFHHHQAVNFFSLVLLLNGDNRENERADFFGVWLAVGFSF